jgi:hypothetical protein
MVGVNELEFDANGAEDVDENSNVGDDPDAVGAGKLEGVREGPKMEDACVDAEGANGVAEGLRDVSLIGSTLNGDVFGFDRGDETVGAKGLNKAMGAELEVAGVEANGFVAAVERGPNTLVVAGVGVGTIDGAADVDAGPKAEVVGPKADVVGPKAL